MPEKTLHRPTRSWNLWKLSLLALTAIASWHLFTSHKVPTSISPETAQHLFRKTLEESNYASDWQLKYSSQPQLPGTNMEMVNWAREKFAEFGLESWVDNYTSWLSYPEETSVKLIQDGKTIYNAPMTEDDVDGFSHNFTIPSFLSYSANGNVTAQYVFCNYGSQEDFKKLVDMGVSLEGKIAVARFGSLADGMFRGLKARYAQEHGMIGVLLYTDPAQDVNMIEQNGFKPYPEGPARQMSAIERGSVQYLSEYPGDPMTPGYALKPGEKGDRQDPHGNTPSVPVLPLSPRDAQPILAKLNGFGPSAEEMGWEKGLIEGVAYSVGPNPDYELNLLNQQNYTVGTLHNIMGKIEGHNKDEVVIIGNHHDSWTFDGADPHSGSASMLEIIRSLSKLLKLGWKPQRTILFASWDGEEYGLLGSTEFGEYWKEKLKKNVVAYLNLDMSVSGPNLQIGASPLLFDVIQKSTDGLLYNSTTTLWDHFNTNVEKGRFRDLGSGSDFTVFIEHLGIPSMDTYFEQSFNSAICQAHSIYDNYEWMAKFGDPGFKLHNLMSRFLGTVLLNLADSQKIPFTTAPYIARLQEFFGKIESQIPESWLSSSAFGLRSDKVTVSDLVAEVNTKLTKLATTSSQFDSSALSLEQNYNHWDQLNFWTRAKTAFLIRKTNLWLKYYERHFLKKDGLRDRPWFKHIVFASGRYTGYTGQQLPAMTESLEDGDFDEFVSNLKFFDRVLSVL